MGGARTFLSLGPGGMALESECKHGHVGYCGTCDAESAPKCEKHGCPWYCVECGKVPTPEPTP